MSVMVTRSEFLERVLVTGGGGCWLWAAGISKNGYGLYSRRLDGRRVTTAAHRLSYELFVGPIPEGLQLDHLCRTRSCVRPDHLEPVTAAENIRRGIGPARTSARLAAQTHCKNGHPLDGDNLYRFVDAAGRPHRQCLTCQRESHRRRRREQVAS